jgi:multimeric flavodoxin WrbA
MSGKNIAIVYHSGFGHTAKVAQAVAAGAKQAKNSKVDVIKADTITEAEWSLLDAADAIIFGAPTYMGSVSGPFKMFMDATSKRWFTMAWKDKIAAGFTNSASYSGDKLASLQQLMVLAMQHGMIWVGQSEQSPKLKDLDLVPMDAINRVGSFSGLMTQSNALSPADIVPPVGDLETAKLFGKRVADIAGRLSKSA